MSNIINCTDSDVHVHLADGRIVTYPRSGTVACVKSKVTADPDIFDNGVPVEHIREFPTQTWEFTVKNPTQIPDGTYSDRASLCYVTGLPDGYGPIIVSAEVGQQMRGTNRRVYGINTSPEAVARNDKNNIVGTRSLVQYHPR